MEALRSRLRVTARALRDASWQLVPASELVPGDVVRLRAGDFLPADAKLVAGLLTVDQSALTGESAQVAKGPDDLIHSGSMVRRGEATALVVLTGASTYFGRTTALVASARPKLHVEEVVARVVRWLFVITGALTALALAALRGLPLLDVAPLLLLLLLSGVPVALPVMFTVSMAVGANELSRFAAQSGRLRVMKGALRTVAATCQLAPERVAALEADAAVGIALPLADLPGLPRISAAQTLTVVAVAMVLTLGLK